MSVGKMLLINPAPKKRRRRKGRMPPGLAAYYAKKKRARKNPRKSRARRNPRLGQLFSKASLKSHVIEPVIAAGIGGAAAVALDVGLAYLPLPDSLKASALANNALRLAGAIALGAGASKVLGKERGRLVTTGALTVAAYSAIRDGIKQVLPADWQAKVKGLGGLADYEDVQHMGVLYQTGGRPAPAPALRQLGYFENGNVQLAGTFDNAFDNAFSGLGCDND